MFYMLFCLRYTHSYPRPFIFLIFMSIILLLSLTFAALKDPLLKGG